MVVCCNSDLLEYWATHLTEQEMSHFLAPVSENRCLRCISECGIEFLWVHVKYVSEIAIIPQQMPAFTGIPMLRILYGGYAHMSTISLPLLVYHPTQIIMGGLLVAHLQDWMISRKRSRWAELCSIPLNWTMKSVDFL